MSAQSDTKIRFKVVDSLGLVPYLAGLRELEASISYPIADGQDAFSIDHGLHYHPFFSRMGKARFLLALQGDEVIGSMAGVWREVDVAARRVTGLYICDLKLKAAWRGKGLVRRMLWYVLLRWPLRRDFQGWRFVYFAAMRGERGDVKQSFRGWHVGRLLQPLSRLALYFVPLARLTTLTGAAPVPTLLPGLNLSQDNQQDWQRTDGDKSFILRSTGQPWPLVHLPVALAQRSDLRQYLRITAITLRAAQPEALACFGVDERLTEHTRWLADQGIERGATCTLYAFTLPWFGPRLRDLAWTHLATSEI